MVLARWAAGLSRFSSRWVPDAWVIAILLTLVSAAAALAVAPDGSGLGALNDVVRAWGDGFWKYLSFAMQMCLVIMTGAMIAAAPPVRRALAAVASLAHSPRGAVALMAFVSLALGWIHWGLSLAASAVLVRHVARSQPRVDYRLLVCCAYLGVGTIFHGGLSGSAPLLVATEGHAMADRVGVISVEHTIFHPFNLTLGAVVLLLLPVLAWFAHPPEGEAITVDPALLAEPPESPSAAPRTPAERIEGSRLVNLAIGAAILWWLALEMRAEGPVAALTLNTLNFLFLGLAVLLHGTPASFLAAAADSGRFVWGIAIQFPFYAGIAGILEGTGLGAAFAQAFQRSSTTETYPLFVLVYSGVLNYFVPSGGSQWIVSGSYIVDAAQELGIGANEAIIAFAWGEMSTNLIQPFWAIPLLAVAGLRFRDIMGFALLLCMLYAALLVVAFAAFGMA